MCPRLPPAFVGPVLNVFTRALVNVEGWVASIKVNSGRDETGPKFPVAPDSDYAAASPKFDHSAWDSVVRKHVAPGIVDGINTNVVDYHSVSEDANFGQYLSELAEADLKALGETPNELLALYVNAYNALCIGHVIRYMKDNDGTLPASVTDASNKKGTEVWDIDAGVVGGETVSLNDVENKILRSKWAEPRVHASINCASASCPNLRTEAFVASRLNAQMDDQSRTWVLEPTKGVKIDADGGDVTFSRIFLWFKGDFSVAGGPVAWASKFLSKEDPPALEERSMNYFEYNWKLNKKSE